MIIVDETILLRYLLDDDEVLSGRAREIIAKGNAVTYPEILARTVVTLRDVYTVPRPVISAAIEALLDDVKVQAEPEVARLAVRLFGSTRMDFTDCLMAARNMVNGDTLASFDKSVVQHAIETENGARRGRPATGR